ncbi:GntR family transcriptional regulator [Glaciibacter psychrotolerans]|uniref:DNA-binding GntR family transcriptional regulator n=1 Tax=Glaciibacter psychrotolerans TaxID=670054 RepID=A0A7Z0EEV9_9MICO|nr:GntR family transcriptional regulator [Leifsonia psychrotolerans]NYJ20379.1 DNA-binding GntR family transcriptional regulator [Leifsonia psychrotolerans]
MTTLSKAQIAHRWIGERINDGRYVPGFRLVLGQIAKELDMSVVPVREAIRLLEAEGLVTFERNIGAQVAMLEEIEYLHTMQTLSIVEGAATALSAPFLTAEHIARARAVNAQMIACLDNFNPHRFTELNLEFHAILFEECPNPHILDLVHRGWNRMNVLRDSTFSFVPGRSHASVLEHEELLRLIEARASALQIELGARAHRTATLDAMLAYQAEHKHPLGEPGAVSLQSDRTPAVTDADPALAY